MAIVYLSLSMFVAATTGITIYMETGSILMTILAYAVGGFAVLALVLVAVALCGEQADTDADPLPMLPAE